jgi:hypothetical protein
MEDESGLEETDNEADSPSTKKLSANGRSWKRKSTATKKAAIKRQKLISITNSRSKNPKAHVAESEEEFADQDESESAVPAKRTTPRKNATETPRNGAIEQEEEIFRNSVSQRTRGGAKLGTTENPWFLD